MTRSAAVFVISSACSSLLAESPNAAQLFAEIEQSTPAYEAAVEAAPGFLDDTLSGYRTPSHRVVRFDMAAADGLSEELKSGPGPLDEPVDLSVFRFNCRIAETASSVAASSGPGGWGASGVCEGSDVRFGVRSKLADG